MSISYNYLVVKYFYEVFMKNKIAEFRKAQNLTQRQLAEKLNIYYQVFQRWENGERAPTVETALRLARVLNTTVEELFQLED